MFMQLEMSLSDIFKICNAIQHCNILLATALPPPMPYSHHPPCRGGAPPLRVGRAATEDDWVLGLRPRDGEASGVDGDDVVDVYNVT